MNTDQDLKSSLPNKKERGLWAIIKEDGLGRFLWLGFLSGIFGTQVPA